MQIAACWCTLMYIGAVWYSLEQIGTTCCSLEQFGPCWGKLVQFGAPWCSLVQLSADWGIAGAVWCKMVQIEAVQCSLAHSMLVRLYSMYDGILFSLRRLVRLVQPCSMNVGMFFGLNTLVRLVQPCSVYVGILFNLSLCYPQYDHVHVCWYFTWSWYIASLSAAMFYVCWYVIQSQYGHVLCMLVQLVQLCSMFFGILFGLSALVSIVQLCSIPLCYGWYAYIKYGHVSFSSVCMNDFIRLCQSCFTSINQCFHTE